MEKDTIFAPLTIKGRCSVYLIRISGEKTLECLEYLGVNKKLEDKKTILCKLKNNENDILDEALVTFFKEPNSFTGENVCEISLHCSSYIINTVFNILLNIEGVRLAEHGEFSKRAFINNKLDLIQAEAINDLVNSETKLQHKQAIEQLEGKNSKFFENLRKNILDINGNIESIIDFPEDDIDESILKKTQNKINNIIENIKNILNDNKVGEKIKKGLNISIIGEPNVGKSTFFNFLAKKDIAIVSNIEGTTRDILQVCLDIDGIPVNFFDTAGIRETVDIIEKEGVKRAIENAKNADLKILLLSPEKYNINENFKSIIDDNTLIIFNKIDLFNNGEFEKIKNNLVYKNIIGISLKDNINTAEVFKYLGNYINKVITPYIGTNITQERYRKELKQAIKFLENIDFNLPIEIIAENIRKANFCIGKITGQINTNEILNNIFGKFCIGK